MSVPTRRLKHILLTSLASLSLSGCYYADIGGPSYASNTADCAGRYGTDYWQNDPYAYADGYGYDCYDAADYRAGFIQIGFSGGWYDRYYYPGHGLWLFDDYGRRYSLNDRYLSYWGGRRAWWQHHGRRDDRRDGRHDGFRHDRPGGRHDDRGSGYGRGGNGPAADPYNGTPRGEPRRDGRPGRGRGDAPTGQAPGSTVPPIVVAPVIQELPAPTPPPQAVRAPARRWDSTNGSDGPRFSPPADGEISDRPGERVRPIAPRIDAPRVMRPRERPAYSAPEAQAPVYTPPAANYTPPTVRYDPPAARYEPPVVRFDPPAQAAPPPPPAQVAAPPPPPSRPDRPQHVRGHGGADGDE